MGLDIPSQGLKPGYFDCKFCKSPSPLTRWVTVDGLNKHMKRVHMKGAGL